MKNIDLKNVVWEEGGNYVSWNINTGISSFGDTKKEALDSLKEALELYFEDAPISKINKINKIDKPDLISFMLKHA